MARVVGVVMLAIGLAVWPAKVGNPAWPDDDQWLEGHVTVRGDDRLRMVVVTVDLDTRESPADGIVDQAFRVQIPSVLVTYEGRALVVYARGTRRPTYAVAPAHEPRVRLHDALP